MFISKKKLNKMITEAQDEVAEKLHNEYYQREVHRGTMEQIDTLNKQVYSLTKEVEQLRDAITGKTEVKKKPLNE